MDPLMLSYTKPNPDETVNPNVLAEIVKKVGNCRIIRPDDEYQRIHYNRLEFLCKGCRTCFMAGLNEFRCYAVGQYKVTGHVAATECPGCHHIIVASLDK